MFDKAMREVLNTPEFQEDFQRLLGGGDLRLVADAPDVWKGVVSPDPEVRESAKRLVAPYGITLE